jgi:hypothetical protein
MKKLKVNYSIFFIIFILASFACSQPVDCSKVRNGKYYYFSKIDRRKVYIVRIDSLQIEIDPKGNQTLRSKIIWQNNCKFQLFVNALSETKLSKQDSIYATMPGTIEILDINSDFYICSVEFATLTKQYKYKDTMYIQK